MMSDAAIIVTPVELAGRWPVRIGRLAGVLSILLGLTVLLGWYTYNQTLLRISPAFVAMAYNTALGFFLCGLGLLAAGYEGWRPARALTYVGGGGAMVIGVVTLGEYFFGVNFGLDELFMKAYVWSGVTEPGRMAFCSALCFTLIGLFLLLRQQKFSFLSFLSALIGTLVIGLGMIALFGYFTGIVQSYAWGAFTRMAVHTAIGFLTLGVGVIAYAWQDDRSGPKAAPRWLPLFVGVGAVTITLCLWQGLVVEEKAQKDMILRLAQTAHQPLGALRRAQSLLPAGELVSGFLLAAVLAGTVALAQTARRQANALRVAQEVLEARVAERTEELAQANHALQETAGWQRGFMRDALASVTEGKLRLCDTPEDLPPHGASFFGIPIFLTRQAGLSDLRCCTLDAADQCGLSLERAQDLVTAVNEAAMNAIVHGGGGFARVSVSPNGTIQVRVTDTGKGITMENLPRATLARGFTTAGTLGHGLKMMLQTSDRLWLLTGPSGTIIALEQDRLSPEPRWMQN